MPDTPEIPATAPVAAPPATAATPADAGPDAPAAAGAAPPRAEPSVADTARLLAQHFPALFGAGVIKPLKLRIQVDIQQRAPGVFSRKSLSLFLQRHTTGTAYLRALVAEGAKRFDLDGQPVGDIAPEHRDAAGVELERRRAIVEAKKHAGREAARASRQDARPARPHGPPPPQQAEGVTSASQPRVERPAPGSARRADRPQRPPRPGRPTERGSQVPQRPHRAPPERKPAHTQPQEPIDTPAAPRTPEQAAEAEARRQRALLLRSFEQSPLSKANFGALKGLSEAALDALLTLARQERDAR